MHVSYMYTWYMVHGNWLAARQPCVRLGLYPPPCCSSHTCCHLDTFAQQHACHAFLGTCAGPTLTLNTNNHAQPCGLWQGACKQKLIIYYMISHKCTVLMLVKILYMIPCG